VPLRGVPQECHAHREESGKSGGYQEDRPATPCSHVGEQNRTQGIIHPCGQGYRQKSVAAFLWKAAVDASAAEPCRTAWNATYEVDVR